MAKQISYNFDGLVNACNAIKSRQTPDTLNKLKNELNKFFKDSTCEEVIYTRNYDKLFFGMTTYAVLDNETTHKILWESEPVRIKKYYLEIDSKLFNLGLTSREITAIVLHEVGHLVNDSTPTAEVRKAIDTYMKKYHTNLSIRDEKQTVAIFKYAIQDSMRRITSFFTRRDEEILADEFVFMCGFGKELESAYKKIVNNSLVINKDNSKLVTLIWAITIYNSLGIHRVEAIKKLNRLKQLSSSQLEQKALQGAINNIDMTAIDVTREASIDVTGAIVITESKVNPILEADFKDTIVSKIQRKGLNGLNEDVFEYQMRIRNVTTEDEAIVLLRQINTRMAILDDFLTNSNITEKEYEKYHQLYIRYEDLREELAEKNVYNKKRYGLWFELEDE